MVNYIYVLYGTMERETRSEYINTSEEGRKTWPVKGKRTASLLPWLAQSASIGTTPLLKIRRTTLSGLS